MSGTERIIKLEHGGVRATAPARLNLAKLEHEGAHLVSRAQAAAKAILEQGRARMDVEAEEIRQQARREGYDEGLRQGMEEGRQAGHQQGLAERRDQIDHACRCVESAMQEVIDQRGLLLRQARYDLLKLAMQIARRVVKVETSTRSAEIAAENARSAIELASRRSMIWIHAHPDDARAIQEYMGKVAGLLNTDGQVKVLADESVSRGGAALRTEAGEVDAQIEAQLDRLEHELLHPTTEPTKEEL